MPRSIVLVVVVYYFVQQIITFLVSIYLQAILFQFSYFMINKYHNGFLMGIWLSYFKAKCKAKSFLNFSGHILLKWCFFFPFVSFPTQGLYHLSVICRPPTSKTMPVSEWSPSSDNTLSTVSESQFLVLFCLLCLLDLIHGHSILEP